MTALVLLMALDAQMGRAPLGVASQFAAELETLQRQETVTPRAEMAEKYKRFIERYAHRPQVARAMILLGHLMATRDPQRGTKPEPEQTMFWFRKAADTASPGSDPWTEAQFLIAGRIRHPLTPENHQKARQILQEIAAKRPNDPLSRVRVEKELQSLCGSEKDWDGELNHCRRVLNWFKDHPQQIPKNPDVQAEMNACIQGACGMHMTAILISPCSKRERAERIKSFAREYPFPHPMQEAVERALKQLKNMPEHVEAEEQPRPAGGYASTGGFSTGRKILTLASFLFLCIWSVWVFSRLIRRVRAGAKASDS